MMTGPFLLAAAWTIRTSSGFIGPSRTRPTTKSYNIYTSIQIHCKQLRLFASASEPFLSRTAESNISRLATLQTLLSQHGAPGSVGCREGNNDLVPVNTLSSRDTPELIATMEGGVSASEEDIDRFCNLHPYLFPIAQSQRTGNVICAYRDPITEEYDRRHPWPIVEAKAGGPGFQLLALNSEHLMRRIVCELDDAASESIDQSNDSRESNFIIQLYNEGLGQGLLKDSKLDTPYERGSVSKLGYGVDKYVLLRVGPFSDLYETMARQHFAKGDEQSALIAAEASNSKLSGFGSTFRFYARLLSSFKNRKEECRDAARMCLRMPLSSIGMDYVDLEEVATLGQMITDDSAATTDGAIQKIKEFYKLMKSVEADEDPKSSGKTDIQIVLEEAVVLLNDAVLDKKEWKDIRPELSKLLRSAGKSDMANFVSFFSR